MKFIPRILSIIVVSILSFQSSAFECSAEILETNTFPIKSNLCIVFGGAAMVDDSLHPQAPAVMLRRFSTNVIRKNRELVWSERGFQTETPRKTQSTTGVTMRFKTNSPTVTLKFVKDTSFVADPDNITDQEIADKKIDSNFGQFRVAINGELTDTILQPNNSSGELTLNGNGSEQEYLLTFPIWQNPILAEFSLEEGYSLSTVEPINKPIMAAIGDSISHGQKQQYSIQTWPWLVAKALDYELYNLAVGGSKTNAVQASMIAEINNVELVTILWGYNDIHSKNKPAITYKADMLAVYNEVRSHHANAKIVFMPVLTAAAEGTHANATKENVLLENEYRSAIRDLHGELQTLDDNIFIIDSDTFTNTDDLAENDPVHLSVSGAAKLAGAVASAIKGLEPITPIIYKVLQPIVSATGPYLINENVVFFTKAIADENEISDFSIYNKIQLIFRQQIDVAHFTNEVVKTAIISDGSFSYNFNDYQAGQILQVRSGVIFDENEDLTFGPWLDLGELQDEEGETTPEPEPEPEPESSGGALFFGLFYILAFIRCVKT